MRAKLSEYRAKGLISEALSTEYKGLPIHTSNTDISTVSEFIGKHGDHYVLKVDQAIKRRNKLGLINLSVAADNVKDVIDEFKKKGYEWLLLEPFVEHNTDSERFLAVELAESGFDITYSKKGGVDIESQADSLEKYTVGSDKSQQLIGDIPAGVMDAVLSMFEEEQLTYLEINPLIVEENSIKALDAAFEVDTSAVFFVNGWKLDDIRTPKREFSSEEKAVDELASRSPASLTLKVLNKDGSIFLLLSGGGASVVVLDEFAAHGLLDSIANYGEYSGNPNEEETYLYTKQVLHLLVSSNARQKTLLIAGGVANFTDIRRTFSGIVRALADEADTLREQNVSIIIRRGGPNQTAGLAYIKEFLDKESIINEVYDPSVSLSQAVARVVEAVK